MSAIFRAVAATTEKVSQALAIAGVLVLAIVIYTGFTIPVPYMKSWFRWFTYINRVYAFEALLVKEIHGRNFPCARYRLDSSRSVISSGPSYNDFTGQTFICPTVGTMAGEWFACGDISLQEIYQ